MAPGMPKRVDFYRLPRPVQDRFAAATRRAAPPAPLLFEPAARNRVWAYLGASLVLGAIAVALLGSGWGNVASPLAIHGVKALAVDVVLVGAAVYCMVHAVAMLRAMEAMPYRPGVYLFPACVVDAHTAELLVWPVGDSEAVERVAAPPGLALKMRDGSRVVVGGSSGAEVERAEAALAARRGELAQAMAEENPHMLAELDPLHDSALSNPIGPSERMKVSTPVWVRLDWALSIGAAVVIGLGLAEIRNSMSDEAMFRVLATSGTVAQLQQYLAQRGKHSAEVSDVLLPRAQLRDAEAQGTMEAVKAFAVAHPSSKIAPEIDAALRRAMLAGLEGAKAAGTVTALDDFAKAYPDHLVDRELKAARHALYAKALAAWSAKAQVDPATRAFMEKLLAYAEKNGPATEVRFRFRPSKSIDDADKSVIRSGPHYPGPDALPSRYVNADALRPREERVGQSIAKALADAFPADVLTVTSGPPLAPDAPLPSVPAIVVDYSPEWSRANVACTRPPTVFAGFIFTFDTSFNLPDGTPPLKVSTRAWRGAELWKIKPGDMSREDYEKAVYDSMIDGAFDTLDKKLNDAFF
jgi:hypothetical protein